MSRFAKTYSAYSQVAASEMQPFGFDLTSVSRLEPVLAFLFQDWWKVNFMGLDLLPSSGPALIVGNTGGVLPWTALMLLYVLMSRKDKPRQLSILAELSWIDDERLYRELMEIGFVPWSSDNAKQLFASGHLVAVFPEGIAGLCKPYPERNRLRSFDWTKLLPAIECNVPIFPLATLGCDESVPVVSNLSGIARILHWPSYPITPFFPWLPFPANLLSLPVKWQMRLLKPCKYQVEGCRDDLENTARQLALFLEGEVQAELNRLLRARMKASIAGSVTHL